MAKGSLIFCINANGKRPHFNPLFHVLYIFLTATFLFPLISYKRFIPESLNRNIKQRNLLTRMRISSVFKKFLQEFKQRTVQDSNISLYDLKLKYLATLESLTCDLGSEVLEPVSLSISPDRDLYNGGYNGRNSSWQDGSLTGSVRFPALHHPEWCTQIGFLLL